MPISNWDDVRIFLGVARSGGLLAAGRRLGLDQTTVARRMSALEAAMGVPLLDRSPRGIALTGHGQTLLQHAERIEAEALSAGEELGSPGQSLSGIVRLVTPEAFAAFLVAPAAKRFHALHPGLQLELAPALRTVNLSRREADIAVSLSRPERGRLMSRKLTDYSLGLYASRAYLDEAGPLNGLEELKSRPLVWYIDEMIDMPELRYLDQVAAGAHTVFRSSSISALQTAVASGLGFGILHVFAASRDPRLVRVLPDQVQVTRSYWLSAHADQARLPRVRAVMDFLDGLIREHKAELA